VPTLFEVELEKFMTINNLIRYYDNFLGILLFAYILRIYVIHSHKKYAIEDEALSDSQHPQTLTLHWEGAISLIESRLENARMAKN